MPNGFRRHRRLSNQPPTHKPKHGFFSRHRETILGGMLAFALLATAIVIVGAIINIALGGFAIPLTGMIVLSLLNITSEAIPLTAVGLAALSIVGAVIGTISGFFTGLIISCVSDCKKNANSKTTPTPSKEFQSTTVDVNLSIRAAARQKMKTSPKNEDYSDRPVPSKPKQSRRTTNVSDLLGTNFSFLQIKPSRRPRPHEKTSVNNITSKRQTI